MIAALNNITTLNGPGATTGQSARVREAGVDDPSTASQAGASAVVSLSAQAQAQAPAPAPAPAPPQAPAVAAQTTSFQPSNARAAATGEKQEFPPTVSLVPNLVYAEADSDQNGVVSPSERRAYDVVHPKLGERPADVPPKRVVDAELREYTSIANNRF